MDTQKPKIHVILGSIREGRAGEKVANWFMETVKDIDSAQLELVDLRDFPLPMFADAELPGMRQGEHSNPDVQRWLNKVAEADGYIIISPEYNHSISSALKNAFDYPYKEWNNKSVGFVTYGSAAGGARAAEHLRLIAAELQMYDVREQVIISHIYAAFDENGTLMSPEAHVKNARIVLEKVVRLAKQLKTEI